jgi:signal transduction histidine kinase
MGRAIQPVPIPDEESQVAWREDETPDDQDLLIASLRAALEEAHAAKAAKTAFLASVSHELRTPLNAILGFAEVISKEIFGSVDPRYADSARSIHKAAGRLHDVLSDIIDMAQLERGRLEVFRENVNLKEVIEEVLCILRERHEPKHARVEIRIDNVFPSLWTDRRRLRQIFTNLISNALSFTPADGRVVVHGHFAPSGDVEIAVIDNGSGMTPDEAKRAVTRFGHAEDELTRKHQGIGLGLPLAKAITELLGGRMKIDSSKGNGTVITMNFALDQVSEQPCQWAAPTCRMAERARRISRTEVAP